VNQNIALFSDRYGASSAKEGIVVMGVYDNMSLCSNYYFAFYLAGFLRNKRWY